MPRGVRELSTLPTENERDCLCYGTGRARIRQIRDVS